MTLSALVEVELAVESARQGDFTLAPYGITVTDVRRNLARAILYADAIRSDPECCLADNGALIAYSSAKTGRSPKDKRIVQHSASM